MLLDSESADEKFKDIEWIPKQKRWLIKVRCNGKCHLLGYFIEREIIWPILILRYEFAETKAAIRRDMYLIDTFYHGDFDEIDSEDLNFSKSDIKFLFI